MTKHLLLFCLLAATAQATITGQIQTPDGIYDASDSPVSVATHPAPWGFQGVGHKTRSTHRFERLRTSPNIVLGAATYRWTASTTNPNEFFCELAAGGNPSLSLPTSLMIDDLVGRSYQTGAGVLDPGSWFYGDNDSHGWSTVYVRLVGNVDPDTAPTDIVAVYGQGAAFTPFALSSGKPIYGKQSSCTFTDATSTITCTDAFTHYHAVTAGDYIEFQHASVNGGANKWWAVTSITSKNAIVIDGSFHNADLTGIVMFAPIKSEYAQLRFNWVTSGDVRAYSLNTDTRPNAPSTTIGQAYRAQPHWAFVCDGECDTSVTISDPLNNDAPDIVEFNIDTTAVTWDGTTYYISAAGDDAGPNSCTNSGTPCQSLAAGITRLNAAAARSRLLVKRGDTGIPLVSATITAIPGLTTTTDKLISTYDSGAVPEFAAFSAEGIFEFSSTAANWRIEDLKFPSFTGSSHWATGWGFNILFSRVQVARTGGGYIFSVSARDQKWITIHDSILSSTGAYVGYLDHNNTGPETSMGVAILGVSATGGGGEHTFRIYPACSLVQDSVITHPGSVTTAGVALRFAAPSARINMDHRTILQNNLVNQHGVRTQAGHPLAFSDTSGVNGFIRYSVIDSNYLDQQDQSLGGSNGFNGDSITQMLWFRNNIVNGAEKAIVSGKIQDTDWHIHGNTIVATRTGASVFEHNESGNCLRNLEFLGNIFDTTNATQIRNTRSSGTEDARLYTTVAFNIWDVGSGNHINIRTGASSVNYSVDTSGTAWTSVHPGETNTGGDGADAVPPELNNPTGSPPDFEPDGDSPCIDAGITGLLADDYQLYGRATYGDFGAIETDGVVPDVNGTCCTRTGTCTETTSGACGHEWTINNNCTDDPCVVGACCFTAAACEVILQSDCVSEGGTWQGAATTCNPDCMGKCCEEVGTCAVTEQSACAEPDDEWTADGTCGTCPTIGCCLDATTCQDLTVFGCGVAGGVNTAADCDPMPCGAMEPDGTCCETDGDCTDTNEATCNGIANAIWTEAETCAVEGCPPAGACCEDNGTCNIETDAFCTAGSGAWQGAGELCTAGRCTLGTCCLANGSCTDTIAEDCANPVTQIWTTGETCGVEGCGTVGACCDTHGTCTSVTSDHCALVLGAFRGASVSCTNACGSCCEPDATCTDTSSSGCTSLGGTYHDGESCGDEGCDPNGACCLTWTTCAQYMESACTAAGGAYRGDGSDCSECGHSRTWTIDKIFRRMGPFRRGAENPEGDDWWGFGPFGDE